jgi:Asp-tRNA(Asn)/Glu-tRNA(Gln) amidotransferase A subunit family amidase
MNRRDFLKTSGTAVAGAALGKAGTASAAGTAVFRHDEYAAQDAIGLADLVRRRQVSAAEVLEAAIARVEAVNPAINAVVLKHYELAREQVRAGTPGGLLGGVPLLLKDLGVGLKGTITTNGSVFFKDAVVDYDSTLVSRYRNAGLVIFGKTASPEFGQTATTESRLWGLTRNPWNLEHSAGGSSGGAAAAVAAGILPAAHASDGGGSIRIPAANCGLFGLKPSRGRVPYGPKALENWMGLSIMHTITRSVRDSALLLDVAQGPEPGSRVIPPVGAASYLAGHRQTPGKLRIALWDQHVFGMPVHADCKEAVARAARLCGHLGHAVEAATPPLPAKEMFDAMGVMTGTGLLVTVRDREAQLGRKITEQEMEPINWKHFQEAAKRGADDLFRARATFDRVGRILDEFFAKYDLILSPTTAVPPPRLGELSLDQPFDKFVPAAVNASPFTAVFNMSGHPAMSVPLHWNDAGLPIGTQFVARFGDELVLLRLAAQLESAAPWARRRPKL